MSALVDRVRVNDNNREPRQPLVLLVDTSSSMADDLPDVAAGLDGLRAALARDPVARNRVELVVVTFGGRVTVHGDFGEAALFEPPPLSASGDTPMASALTQALDLLEAKKQAYRRSGSIITARCCSC
ncbi:vWA domain-containing protein [Nannocystis pusilla]|uniref:vWA domain-containing protein n=1 Tax=Nannocystis pusilla TaxID=889268 RepID=UPI003B7DF9A6